MTSKLKKRLTMLLCIFTAVVILCAAYVQTHPLVFNESFWEHAHCIKQVGLAFPVYAHDNDGRFPYHTNGYGDALLLIPEPWPPSLTGPGYDSKIFETALKSGIDVPESECGRVYVQGLSDTSAVEIAILFDKLPTPGGDHCHFVRRIFAPLGREVWTVGGGMQFIPESKWRAYSKEQIELLVLAGIAREQAEMYYSEKPKR